MRLFDAVFEAFCDDVCKEIQYAPAHAAIRGELMAHLADHAAALQEMGVPEEEAQREAVAAMGNAVEIGRALDEQHKPFWGQLLTGAKITTKVLLVCFVLLFFITAGLWGGISTDQFYYHEKVSMSDQSFIIDTYTFPVNTWRDFGGLKIHIRDACLIQHEYASEKHPFSYSLRLDVMMYQKDPFQQRANPCLYQLHSLPIAHDDLGNTYLCESPFAVERIDPDASLIYVDYETANDRLTYVVELDWGDLQ